MQLNFPTFIADNGNAEDQLKKIAQFFRDLSKLSVISIPREGGYAGAGHLAGYFVGL